MFAFRIERKAFCFFLMFADPEAQHFLLDSLPFPQCSWARLSPQEDFPSVLMQEGTHHRSICKCKLNVFPLNFYKNQRYFASAIELPIRHLNSLFLFP